jgi:hypothetical protein
MIVDKGWTARLLSTLTLTKEEEEMTNEAGSQALQQLFDSKEIERLIFDYAFHLDMNHPAELAALFIDDCEVSYAPNFGAVGKKAYLKTLDGIGDFFVATSHHVSNICVDFTSDTAATVRSVVYAFHRYTRDQPDSHVWGQYADEMIKVDGKWFFKRGHQFPREKI